ncbi:hypothetical protein ABLV98_15380 [Staphylococcus sp. 50Mo3-1]|uniref:hypothetical protein n=1 Tax=Staphylococcus sp. 50Mo3-2 TaxID=3135642 RepID=UPI0033E4644C
MGVKVKGLDLIEDEIYSKYSRKAIDKAEKRAIKAGGNMIRNKVATSLYGVRDTGSLAIGTDLRDPEKVGNEMIANLYWRGDHQSLAYVNEFGHTLKDGSFYKPKGAGVVNTQLKLNVDLYFKILKGELDKK